MHGKTQNPNFLGFSSGKAKESTAHDKKASDSSSSFGQRPQFSLSALHLASLVSVLSL